MSDSEPESSSRSDPSLPSPNPDPETNPYIVERPPYRDPEWLEEQYHGEGKSLATIADEQGVSRGMITYQFRKHDIPRRPTGREMLPDGVDEKLRDEWWLYEQYWVAGQSVPKMADDLGVDEATVHRALRSAGVERRSAGEAQRLRWAKLKAHQDRERDDGGD